MRIPVSGGETASWGDCSPWISASFGPAKLDREEGAVVWSLAVSANVRYVDILVGWRDPVQMTFEVRP